MTFNYSLLNENNVERKKVLKFFISTLLECNVMVNETISYRSPDKIQSIMHYIKTDHEARITPVGVYSSLGKVDYFAFQKSTKTFKIDFLEPLTNSINSNMSNGNYSKMIPERKKKMPFRREEHDEENLDEENESSVDKESEINFFEKNLTSSDNDNGNSNNNTNSNKMKEIKRKKYSEKNLLNKNNTGRLLNETNTVKKNNYNNNDKNFTERKTEAVDTAVNANTKSLKNKNDQNNIEKSKKKPNKMGTHSQAQSQSQSQSQSNSYIKNLANYQSTDPHNKMGSQSYIQNLDTKKNPDNSADFETVPNTNINQNQNDTTGKFVDFNLEYIYDAKHLIHSVSDFRSTPNFNNITYNFDRFYWYLKNENFDKSDDHMKIEFFFDMEESFYTENIFLNLNFTKTIFLLNQTERGALENTYTKLDSNLMLEFTTYTFDAEKNEVILEESVMNQSPDLDRMKYYVKNKNSKNRNDLLKIMKVEAVKTLKYNETFQLEIKFPLYFENCRNYKTNTMIMITGIVLMVFLGSILYLIVSLNFSDKD